MQRHRRTQGFTIFELMIVMAIMAVMLAFAAPGFNRYRQREGTKSDALMVASALRLARARAMKEGVQYILILNPAAGYTTEIAPDLPGSGTNLRAVARLVRDDDRDQVESADDTFAMNVTVPISVYSGREYDPATDPFSDALQPDDPNATLAAVEFGTTFKKLDDGETSAVGFTNRGIPFDPNVDPPAPPSGQGAYYMTDGQGAVFAVVLLPLGEVRVRTLSPVTNGWR